MNLEELNKYENGTLLPLVNVGEQFSFFIKDEIDIIEKIKDNPYIEFSLKPIKLSLEEYEIDVMLLALIINGEHNYICTFFRDIKEQIKELNDFKDSLSWKLFLFREDGGQYEVNFKKDKLIIMYDLIEDDSIKIPKDILKKAYSYLTDKISKESLISLVFDEDIEPFTKFSIKS